jgi:hypothetical protein
MKIDLIHFDGPPKKNLYKSKDMYNVAKSYRKAYEILMNGFNPFERG